MGLCNLWRLESPKSTEWAANKDPRELTVQIKFEGSLLENFLLLEESNLFVLFRLISLISFKNILQFDT